MLYAVPVIMLLFFVRNVIMVETQQLDSWMGGGMRMFGKIDKMLYRASGFTIMYDGKEYFVNFRNIPELEDEDVALRILPSESRKSDVLNKVRNMKWCYHKETDKITLYNSAITCDSSVPSKSIISVKVFKVDYDGEAKQIKLQLIK